MVHSRVGKPWLHSRLLRIGCCKGVIFLFQWRHRAAHESSCWLLTMPTPRLIARLVQVFPTRKGFVFGICSGEESWFHPLDRDHLFEVALTTRLPSLTICMTIAKTNVALIKHCTFSIAPSHVPKTSPKNYHFNRKHEKIYALYTSLCRSVFFFKFKKTSIALNLSANRSHRA